MCPFGYGNWTTLQVYIYGNGLSVYKNPSTGAKTLVVTFSVLNSAPNVHNALKIGISNTGSPIHDETNSKLFINRLGFDGARFLNPERPGDLYISPFGFNVGFIQYQSRVDPKVGVQIVQFTPDQLDATIAVPSTTVFPTTKYCSLSAGPLTDLSSVAAYSVPALSQSTLTLKIYNSVDCNPSTSERVIAVPYTANACNVYSTRASASRYFKIRCLSGEGFNGIHAANKYFFQDFSTQSQCNSASAIEPITSTSGVNESSKFLTSGRQAINTFTSHCRLHSLHYSAVVRRCPARPLRNSCITVPPAPTPTQTPIPSHSTQIRRVPPLQRSRPPPYPVLLLVPWRHSSIRACKFQNLQVFRLERIMKLFTASGPRCCGRGVALAKV